MKKIIDTLLKQKQLVLLLSLLIASLVVSLKFSSYSWAINPTTKKEGYVKITNIKNGDIIPNKKDVVVEFSADSMTMPMRGARYIGKIRYLILTVNGEPYGTYENNQDKGTYTFQIDLSKLEDETPVKLQALGYLHTAPKSLIRLWEQKKMKIDQLQNFLKNLTQFKSEELGISKDGNPFDLPKSVNPDDIERQGIIDNGWVNPYLKEPESGPMKWLIYTYNGSPDSSIPPYQPKYKIEYPSTWSRYGEGNIAFSKPGTTTRVSIGFYYIPGDKTLDSYLDSLAPLSNSLCLQTQMDGKDARKCNTLNGGGPFSHEGDKSELFYIPYQGLEQPLIIQIAFNEDKYKEPQKDIWNHIINSFHILE